MIGKLALGLTAVPLIGAGLCIAYPCGDPLTPLGQGAVIAGTPLAFSVGLKAKRSGRDKPFSTIAFGLSTFELIAVIVAAIYFGIVYLR